MEEEYAYVSPVIQNLCMFTCDMRERFCRRLVEQSYVLLYQGLPFPTEVLKSREAEPREITKLSWEYKGRKKNCISCLDFVDRLPSSMMLANMEPPLLSINYNRTDISISWKVCGDSWPVHHPSLNPVGCGEN